MCLPARRWFGGRSGWPRLRPDIACQLLILWAAAVIIAGVSSTTSFNPTDRDVAATSARFQHVTTGLTEPRPRGYPAFNAVDVVLSPVGTGQAAAWRTSGPLDRHHPNCHQASVLGVVGASCAGDLRTTGKKVELEASAVEREWRGCARRRRGSAVNGPTALR